MSNKQPKLPPKESGEKKKKEQTQTQSQKERNYEIRAEINETNKKIEKLN